MDFRHLPAQRSFGKAWQQASAVILTAPKTKIVKGGAGGYSPQLYSNQSC